MTYAARLLTSLSCMSFHLCDKYRLTPKPLIITGSPMTIATPRTDISSATTWTRVIATSLHLMFHSYLCFHILLYTYVSLIVHIIYSSTPSLQYCPTCMLCLHTSTRDALTRTTAALYSTKVVFCTDKLSCSFTIIVLCGYILLYNNHLFSIMYNMPSIIRNYYLYCYNHYFSFISPSFDGPINLA